MDWTEEHKQAFKHLKEALVQALALALPDFSKHFHVYIHERKGVARVVLTQTLGPWKRLVAYISARLDPMTSG